MNNRAIQAIAAVVLLVCVAASGRLLSPMHRVIEEKSLRYTDVSVEGAPFIVAVGTAIGALRGLIVDYLWIKVHIMKEKGLFYEVMDDAELITKLQPRFGAVWIFHGHNMAYNISVATNTPEERWEWVQAGIRLVRSEGLRYNPNDLTMHRELAFWFAHKIEGYADDAHLYYKREFTKKWHYILGPPPDDYQERIAWIKAIADAPETLADAEARTPGVFALIDEMEKRLTPHQGWGEFAPTSEFLQFYGEWQALTEQSDVAQALGYLEQSRRTSPFFQAFDELASDPEWAEQWDTLVSFVRKKVLRDEFNMDPRYMYEFTRDLGPIDWRHGQAHALYWTRLGSIRGEARYANPDEVYKVVNNDRQFLQSMQGLARYGRITFDPFSQEIPGRYPDPRWIDAIAGQFNHFYAKHYDTQGAGGETFIGFLENFMASAIRQTYRSGDTDRAQELLDMLDEKFGMIGNRRNPKYAVSVEQFVREELQGEIELQPHIAPSEVYASLRNGFLLGVARNDEERYKEAVQYSSFVIRTYKDAHDYTTKMGTERMAGMMQDLPTAKRIVFAQLMTDPSIRIREKKTIWDNIDRFEQQSMPGLDPRSQQLQLRARTYDMIAPRLERQFATHELSNRYSFDEFFPPPPNLDAVRRQMAEEFRRQQERRQTDEKALQGSGG